jgi:hypothetical protein
MVFRVYKWTKALYIVTKVFGDFLAPFFNIIYASWELKSQNVGVGC